MTGLRESSPSWGMVVSALGRVGLIFLAVIPGLSHLIVGANRMGWRLLGCAGIALIGWQGFVGTWFGSLMSLGLFSLAITSVVDFLRLVPGTDQRRTFRIADIFLGLAVVLALQAGGTALAGTVLERVDLQQAVFQLHPLFASGAREEAFSAGDRVFFTRHAYRNADPQRGDIVLATASNMLGIHRILAVPGDRLAVVRNRMYINGKELAAEAYPLEPAQPAALHEGGHLVREDSETTLGRDQYAVWGVNFAQVEGQAAPLGPLVISGSDIEGKAWLVYSPFLHRRFVQHLIQ